MKLKLTEALIFFLILEDDEVISKAKNEDVPL